MKKLIVALAVIAAVLFAVSAVGTAFPPGVEVLMLWRLVGGAGIGVAARSTGSEHASHHME